MNEKTRLVVEIPEIIHKRMRISIAEQNMSIKEWIMIAILAKLNEEDAKKIEK